MNSSNDIEYPKKILDYMEGFLVSKTLFAACELGVFDFLLVSEQSMSSADIAKGLKTSVDGMERLLMACVGLQLLHADIQNGEALYSNTELSRIYLTRTSPKSLFHSIQYNSQTIYLCWHYLADAVREGKNQYEKAFGVSSGDLFEALYRSDEEMITFMKLMNSVWNTCGKDVVTAFDLSPFKSIHDLGGCSGAVAKQCVSAYPESMVTIFDLPKVVQMAKEHFVSSDERRISFHEGDFFRDPIPASDLYILARILHDWTDEKCLELLIKVNKACKPGGGLLLIEALLNEDKSGPLTTQLYSLNMLVQTEGRERSPSEYIHLMEAAGFTDIQIKRTGKLYDAVLGRK
ncbi:acetylserotonin O-methyltransferase [Acipenser oxyrinchus oxyrinchus]|uniref:Acetylserotonin O-methyltransferase n=1 Tax=Acipenser oxyrinchus oxyrinchus TaxID=40147 RepID=A0AAD8G8T3_ACIOX|nr:acetylserotonin O-methyltransferase [Acipenser oxyrinchus oxyrinchus]